MVCRRHRPAQHTLMKTMRAIVDHQRAYFLSGDEVDLNR